MFRFSSAVLVLFLATGCVLFKPVPKAPPGPRPKAYWRGEGVAGTPSIRISIKEQRAYFFRDKKLVGESIISSGRKGFDTPPGQYTVIQKDARHVSNLYGDYVDAEGEIVKRNIDVTKDPMPEGTEFRGAKMPYFMRFTRGYGLHAGQLPGYAASHGCVRMPLVMARLFFDNVVIGTQVVVEE